MNRRSNKDRRFINYRVLTDKTERRKILERRDAGMDVFELNISEEVFATIFAEYVSNNKRQIR